MSTIKKAMPGPNPRKKSPKKSIGILDFYLDYTGFISVYVTCGGWLSCICPLGLD